MLENRPWTVLAGDCLQTLAALPAESIDACVTDTPYGLSTLLDPPNLDREALWRRLTQHQQNRRPLRDYVLDGLSEFVKENGREPHSAEWIVLVDAAEVRRTMEGPAIERLMRAWLDTGENPVMKGRGFMGKEWDALVPAPNTWKAIWRVLKPGAYCLAFGGTRTYALIEMSLRLADFEIEDHVAWLQGQGFPKRVRLDLKIDQHFGKAGDRQIVGVNPSSRPNSKRKNGGGFDNLQGAESAGLQHHTAPATPDAARFVGWDRALRPGWEPIIVACKPLRGTVAENALAYGTGGLRVDACRLERGDAGQPTGGAWKANPRLEFRYHKDDTAMPSIDARGGYPANVAMDEETAAALDRVVGDRVTKWGKDSKSERPDMRGRMETRSISQNGLFRESTGQSFHDSGGPSRFFYTAKASTSERDAGLEDLPPLTSGERCDREDGSAGVNGYAGTRGDGGRNPHPTVKPLSLMRWLCRLASPPGAWDPHEAWRPVILDPFAGSGSTLVAGLLEGMRVIGCELDEKMADVARRRCQHAYALPREEADINRSEAGPGTQATLF